MKKILLSLSFVLTTMCLLAAGHVVTTSVTNASCNGSCNGTAASSVSGGSGSYTFSWTGGGFTSTAQNVVGLCAGTYTVTVTDMNDMSTATATAVISQPGAMNIITGTTNPSCGSNNGSITGQGGCTYNWVCSVAPTNGINMTGLHAGTYTVTGSCSGCTSTAVVTLVNSPSPTVTIANSSPVCSGGSVMLSSTVSSGNPPYLYNWSPASGLNSGNIPSPTASPAVTTTYTLSVTDANGCNATATTTVIIQPMDDPSFSYNGNMFCISGTDPSPVITGNNGGVFSTSPGLVFVNVTTGTIDLSASTLGNYYVVYTTSGPCPASDTVNITLFAGQNSAFAYTPSIYCYEGGGTATPVFYPGASAGTFNGNAGLMVNNVTGEVDIAASVPGTYTVFNTIPASNGCAASSSTAVITIVPEVDANFTMVPDSTNAYNFWCFNSSIGTGAGYLWFFGDGTTSTLASPTHTFALAGTYTICLEVSTGGYCADTLCQTITVTGNLNACNALFNIGDNVSSSDPNAYTITNLSYGSTLTYLWDFGDSTTSTQQDPSHIYSTSSGPYEICLTVNNGAGCTSTYCDSIFSADSISRTNSPISFTVVEGNFPLATGIQENSTDIAINAYPNPFTDQTTFVINSKDDNDSFTFEMTDVLGKVVRTIKTNEKQFTVSRQDLKNGMYFYSVSNADAIIGMGKAIIK
jgi:PKD repeat protein